MARIDELLRYLVEHKGSDLHLRASLEPRIRVSGRLEAVDRWGPLEDDDLRAMLGEIATPKQWEEYQAHGDLDFAYGLDGVARFRANFLVQEKGAGAVFRTIPEKIIPLEQLGLPSALEKLVELHHGLVLVTGPTGSGKSTTLAAMIDRINRGSRRHVVTLEDPIEFVHRNKSCVFSHREVGNHSQSFQNGLRAAIRQDADVILVGEMRDYETISLAITAAEMGLLVFGTLHTNGATKTIDRIIDSFPSDEQPQARLSLSESLAGVVSQLLLPRADGKGRVAALEILLRCPGLANVIREGNIPMLTSMIQQGKREGMQLMDDHLFELVERRTITPQDAYMKALDKPRFEPLLPKE
jgi:twitching motility protein PilT